MNDATGRFIHRLMAMAFGIFICQPLHAEIDWTEVTDISEQDKQEIVELVRTAGMSNAAKASITIVRPGGTRMIRISSPVAVSGQRRTWTEVSVCRPRPAILDDPCTYMKSQGEGNWKISGDRTREERWRFSDGDWFVDVALGSAISYAEAEAIVVAIHRNQLVRTPESGSARYTFDASNIYRIVTPDPIAGVFAVVIDNGGSGYYLEVRLRDGKVELNRLMISRA